MSEVNLVFVGVEIVVHLTIEEFILKYEVENYFDELKYLRPINKKYFIRYLNGNSIISGIKPAGIS